MKKESLKPEQNHFGSDEEVETGIDANNQDAKQFFDGNTQIFSSPMWKR